MKSIYSFTVNLVKEVEKKTKEKRTNKPNQYQYKSEIQQLQEESENQ